MPASTFLPTAGSVGIAKFTTTGAGGTANPAVTVPGINWTAEIDPKLAECSNFRDGRMSYQTLRLSTINITLVWDSAEQPTKAADAYIRGGSTGSISLYTDATHFFVVPFVVGTCTLKNEGVENVLMYDVTLVESNQSGVAFAWPLDT